MTKVTTQTMVTDVRRKGLSSNMGATLNRQTDIILLMTNQGLTVPFLKIPIRKSIKLTQLLQVQMLLEKVNMV